MIIKTILLAKGVLKMATRDYSEGLPFALMRWIKAQLEKEEKHQTYWALKNAVNDQHFLFYLSMLAQGWTKLSKPEQMMVRRFTEWKYEGRNFSPSQKSVIGGMYAKHVLKG
jgi:hypothetical protein